MINEFQEYNDYTRDLFTPFNPGSSINTKTKYYARLQHNTLIRRHGLKRVLTIIARRFIYHSKNEIEKTYSISEEIPKNRIILTKKALTQWCTYKPISNPVSRELLGIYGNGRFYDYMTSINQIYSDIIKKGKNIADSLMTDLKKRNKALEKNINYWEEYLDKQLKKDFYSLNEASVFKFNTKKFTFDSIIADAILQGPLKSHQVLINKKLIIYLKNALNIKWNSFIPDIILMAIIYSTQSTNNDNLYQLYNIVEVSNWLRKRLDKDKLSSSLDIMNQKGFYGEDHISNSSKKIYFRENITKHIHLNTLSDINEDSILVEDQLGLTRFRSAVHRIWNEEAQHRKTD